MSHHPVASWVAGLGLSLVAFDGSTQVEKRDPPGYAIERVSVVDVEGGRLLADRTVLVEGTLIRRILPSAEAAVPAGFERIDGAKHFLIPGLFDAHVHFADPPTYGPLCIAHGVTCVRDMGASTEEVLELRDQLNLGKKLGPEMICTGAILDGKPPIWPFSEVCDTPEKGRAAVKKLVDAGVNQIKVYSVLERDVYLAIADEAKARNVKFVGHVPERVTLDDAMKAGQHTNEHLMGFGAEIARLAGKPVATALDARASDVATIDAWKLFPEVDRKKLEDLTRRLRESGMVQCPTLVVHEGIRRLLDPDAKDDPRLKWVWPPMLAFWQGFEYRVLASHFTSLRFMYEMVAELHRAGVPLIVGTDLANPYVFAGSSVHEEMESFAKAGIPAADVLRAATLVPARACGVADRLGSIAEGKTASLVLLRADPLAKTSHVREVEAVFLRGRYFDRAQLDRLMKDARDAVTGSNLEPIDVKVEVPGEIVARGTYRMTFGGADAGTEEFAIGRDAEGFHFMAVVKAAAGWGEPVAAKLRYDSTLRPLSGEYRGLGDSKTVARYTVKDRKVEATAVEGGEPAGDQTIDLPEGAFFGGPAVAGDYFLYQSVPLAPGESRDVKTVSFGFEGWRLESSTLSMKRLDDTDLARPSGKTVRVRRYAFATEVPALGKVTAATWVDERGVMLKDVMTLPFGTLTWELE